MANSRYKIEFRHMQLVYEGNNVVVQCSPDGNAEYVRGNVELHEWQDVTEFTEGLDKLSLEWSATSSGNTDGGETNAAGSNYDKGISLSLTFRNTAWKYIYDYLLNAPCSLINAIEVKITDLLCGKSYRLFEIKADNLTYKPYDAPCEFEVRLREQDLVWHCVHKTFIWDNWQHWFEDGSAKQHPCFLTALEPRPRIISSAKLGLLMFGMTIPVVPYFLNLGGDNDVRSALGIDNFVPAPLVRDYLANFCGKCGLTMETMFDDLPENDYRNLCVYYPISGAKFWHKHNTDDVLTPEQWFYFENRWLVTGGDLLDFLKKVFKAEWYVTPGSKLIFQSKLFFNQAAAIYDFTGSGTLKIYELEYTFDGTKKPAYGRYEYQPDGADMASQEIQILYNDLVDYDGPANNPMLEGESSNSFDFAPTGFVRDGRASDYLRDLINDAQIIALILVGILTLVTLAFFIGLHPISGAALGGFVGIWVVDILARQTDWINMFAHWDTIYTGAVRITMDQVGTPRLLLWDGVSKECAKVVRQGVPDPNPLYNPTLIPYTTRNSINGENILFNYPLYFDGFYKANLFDKYHSQIDNPLLSLETHQNFSFRLDLCCEVMDVFGLWDGDFARIGYIIKIEDRENHAIFGKITGISLENDEERVVIKGNVLKRLN